MPKHINNQAPGGASVTPFIQVPVWLARSGKNVSNGAFRLYAVIKSYTQNGQNTAYPSQKTLANDLGVSERQIHTYMLQLRDSNAVRFERRIKGNGARAKYYEYTLAWDTPFSADDNDQKNTSTDTSEDSPEDNFRSSAEENFHSSPEENFRETTPTEHTPFGGPTDSPPPF